MRVSALCVLSVLVACSGDTATKDATDQTDAEDTGTTPPPAAADATGTWVGECSGTVTSTYDGYTYTGVFDTDSTLELVDTDGAVEGDWLYTVNYTTTTSTYSSGYRVGGTRDDDHLMLEVLGYTTTTGTITSTGFTIAFDLTLDGDEAAGDLVIESYGVERRIPCTFTR